MSVLFANNNSLSAITTLPSGVGGGSMNLISTQTASSSSTVSFTSGIDSTYKEYIFKFINIHGSADANFVFNMSVDGGSNYNVTKTTSYFVNAHSEDDSSEAQQEYRTSDDLAQSTDFQILHKSTDSGNDDCGVGTLHLFDPSNTTFVKHFLSVNNYVSNGADGTSKNPFIAGYGNTTSAVNAVQFKMSSGNIDSGTIKLYGIS